jgi:hypothetical protein
MSTIVTRAGKGSPLTNNEVDTNFTNLNSDKYQSGDSPSFAQVNVDNIQLNGNTVSSTNTDGNIVISPNGAGTVDVDNSKITGLSEPTLTTDAATKQYVDSAVSTGFIVHDSAVYATAAPLPNSPIYNNGAAGVGATITANTNAALVIDGVTLVSPTNNGIRVLVKNEVSSQYNGIYDVTESGSGSAPWVLTRSTDFNTVAAGNVSTNAYVYITAGSTNIGSSWIFSQVGSVTLGTTPLHFELFAQPIGYNATAPLNITGQTIALTGTVEVNKGGTGATTLTGVLKGNGTSAFTAATAGTDFVAPGGALGTPSSGTLTNCTFPTLNQNTTGNAATATTATNASNLTGGNITGNMVVANATSPNSYYLQFGDNSGWVYRFMTNVAGTPTVRFSFQDNGAFTAVNNITAYSDERLKKNWRPVQENFVEKLAQVKSGIYDRTDIEATQAGVSAQEMQKLLAETVQTGEDGTLSLAYGNAALVAAIELAKQVVELKKEIELLKAR